MNGREHRFRKGAVAPLFALMMPVLIILCAFAINLAHVQLLNTEIKISTDAAAHAGGRAMSITQNTDSVYLHVQRIARMNKVDGRELLVGGNDDEIQFGRSIREDNGYGRYDFEFIPKADVDHHRQQATSVAVVTNLYTPLIFSFMPEQRHVNLGRLSIATQVDRDIALVLDRSGSMLEYRDYNELLSEIYVLYRRGQISWRDYRNARRGYYSSRIARNLPDGPPRDYVNDRLYSAEAPRYSRWYYLDLAVDAFLDVLEVTDQEEQVSLVTFSSSARLDTGLDKEFYEIRDEVDKIYPYGATAIGQGLRTGLPPIIESETARPFASKTIVVLTDGRNNVNPRPQDVVRDLVAEHNVTIHTVTFTLGADQGAMQEVARAGGGKHYHANEGDELIAIFEEIANNLPTILTQ